MPRIDRAAYEAAEASQGGFEQVLPGAYMLRVAAVRSEWDERDFKTGADVHKTAAADQCILLVWDIDEGPFAGEFTRDFYLTPAGALDPAKDFMHQAKYGWWNMGRFKAWNEVLAACNPGFDPVAAVEADQWGLFVGKRFAAVVDGTVRLNDNGFDQWRLKVGEVIMPDDLRTGNHREPKVTDKRGGSAPARTAQPQAAADPYGDIPL